MIFIIWLKSKLVCLWRTGLISRETAFRWGMDWSLRGGGFQGSTSQQRQDYGIAVENGYRESFQRWLETNETLSKCARNIRAMTKDQS